MKTVKILHCADIHIGATESFLGTLAASRRIETLMTFEKIVDLCLEKEVELLAIAGDLFDSNSVEEGLVNAVFEKIASANPLKVVFAAGNHDPLNLQSPFVKRKIPQNLFVLGTQEEIITFEELSLKVYGRSFETAFLKGIECPSIKAEGDGYIKLRVQHGELKGDLNSQYNAITPSFIKASGMDYIALGHIHKNTEIGKIGDTSFAYCGCPEGQGFDELQEKGVLLGEIGKGICKLEFVPVSKRRHLFEKIDITHCTSTTEIVDSILKALEERHGNSFGENLYKIALTGELSPDFVLDLPAVSARLSDSLYFVKVRDNTQLKYDLSSLVKEQSLRGIFVKKMLDKIESSDVENRTKLEKALDLGLRAFKAEVSYNED